MPRCKNDGEWYNEYEDCGCDDEECPASSYYIEPATKQRLEKLRTSEFASDIMRQLTKVFPLSEEQIAKRLGAMFEDFEGVIEKTVVEIVRTEVQRRAIQHCDEKMGALLDDMFTRAIDEHIVELQSNNKPLMKTIREHAITRINDFMAKQSNDRHAKKETIDKTVEHVLGEKIDVAINEIKSEAIDKFNKEAMKRMMSGMAKAIGEDAKLARLLMG